MEISTSILDASSRLESVLKLNQTNTSYIHIDVMDGNFVPNKNFFDIDEVRKINNLTSKPLDVHLMVEDPIPYIKKLGGMNIKYITFHLEIESDIEEVILEIKKLGYLVGVAIKPGTDISKLFPYLDKIDMVLVMSVEPGLGGQKFMMSVVDRTLELRKYTQLSKNKPLIEVDGGINDKNILMIPHVDIAVVGSYVIKSDNYSSKIDCLLK